MFVLSPLFQTRSRCINLTFLYTLVRSGYIDLTITAGTLRAAGYGGVWWSSRTYSSADRAYDFYFTTVIYPSNISGRYCGFSLRCLSTVLDM